MARKKKKGSSRKRPLVFTESPVEVSRRFPSPIFAARNPVGADLVPVKGKRQLWISPQIDPNAPHTPPRRCRARRNKTACALDPLTQTQRRKEITRKEASLQFLEGNGKWMKIRGRQVSSSDSATESSTDSDPTEKDPAPSDEGASRQTSSAEKLRNPLGEIGISGRTRARRRISQSCSQSRNQLPSKDLRDELKLTSDSDSRKNKSKEHACVDGSQKENRWGKDDSIDCHSDKPSSNQGSRDSFTCMLENNNACRPNLTKNHSKGKRPNSVLRKCVGVMSSSCSHKSGLEAGESGRLSSTSPSGKSRSSARRGQNSALCGDSDANGGICRPKHRRAKKASPRSGDVLVYDTPEAEYGIRVSLRRRRKLLPTPARNKLMCF